MPVRLHVPRHHDSLESVDARRLLSVDDNDPGGWSRRKFLQAVAYGVVGGVAVNALDSSLIPGMLPGQLRDAWAAAPVGPTDGILVVIVMFGGNDGLNTLVPYANGDYYRIRGGLAIPRNQVLALDGNVGLNPNLTFLKSMYDVGQVAVVQGVGYPNPDRSHFSSMAHWMNGRAGTGAPTSGWVGRWLDGMSDFDAFRAATVSTSVPLHMVGNVRRATGIPEYGGAFGSSDEEWEQRLYAGVRGFSAGGSGRGPWHDAIARTEREQLDVAQAVSPLFVAPLPESEIVKKLTLAARLINANIGLRVVDVGWGDFDSHDDQPGMHPDRMAELDEGLRQFFTGLDDAYRDRVTVMTISEFGRQPYPNDSLGTDHGTASCLFAIGSGIKGGLYGQQPGLSGLEQWEGLAHHVDFRSVYATVLDGWMGGGADDVLGGSFPRLGFFKNGPGQGSGGVLTPAPPALSGDYVPLQPFRLFDSRNGIGGRRTPLGPGTTAEIETYGRGGIPTEGVTAVALNVTAVGATAASYFTVWPARETRPTASSLNFTARQTVPNLVVMKPGVGGRISIWNESGEVHALADVVGYFRESPNDRLLSLQPARLLDTRNGVGAPKAKVAAGGTVGLTVTGVGGVPATGVDAVVLNVTVDGGTAESYLTVWPNGEALPNASSLNFTVGQTVPNLVIAKVGESGKVNIFNAFGQVNIIADVVGCFTAQALGRHKPVGPERILDTRNNIYRNGVLTNQTFTMAVAGRAGVPATATAAILNVTVAAPTTTSFLTVWPSGQPMPTASSLNYTAGLTVANLVMVKLGPDGAINLTNAFGTTHVIADVVGYFE